MSAREAFRIYNSLKLHFTTESYNYFKYSGKITNRIIPENQYHAFEKLSKRYGDDLEDFYISNFLENPKIWVLDLLSEESDEIYQLYKKRQQSLSYMFRIDINNLFEGTENLNDLLVVKKDFPVLLKRTLQKRTNLETLLILNSILKFFSVWNNNIKDDIVWKGFYFKCIKYFPFMKYDREKMKEILKTEVKKYAK